MAHANDLGGSIRYPAAWCGLVGLKPTRARVPLGPQYGDVVSGLAVEHALTRSVRDTAALLDAVAGPAPGDPYQAPPTAGSFLDAAGDDRARLRIALSTSPRNGQTVDPEWAQAAQDAALLLEQLGHVVEEAAPPGLDERYEAASGAV
jgi:amidase